MNHDSLVMAGSGRHPARQPERHRKNEPLVVVGVFSDEIDAARSAIDARNAVELRSKPLDEVGNPIGRLECSKSCVCHWTQSTG